MKMMILVLAVMFCLLMFSCGPNPEQSFSEGYRKGAADAVRNIEENASRMRGNMKDELFPKLILMSIIAVGITLVGTEIAEHASKEICASFKWGKNEQLCAAWMAYICSVSFIAGYSLTAFRPYESVPVLILLGGTFPSFMQVVEGIEKEDAAMRKSGLGKVKTLMFLCLVVIMVYYLLSGGIAKIKVG